MKKQKYYKHTQPIKQEPSAKNIEKIEKKFSWITFSVKILILFFAILAVVIFTDKKEYFVGDQINNHVQRKWRSFYKFTEKGKKDVDILILGNSHASAGIEPFILSQTTNTNCFILNTPGASINDMYFNLKEVLRYTTPKIVIIETFCFYGNEMGLEWGRIQSFESKKRNMQRLYDMFFLFKSDDWVKAWSPTIRNHSFLLTDTERIGYNVKNVGKDKNPDRMKLDLGRFLHGSNFMQDTTLAKYDSIGPPLKCENIVINDANKKYLRKITELCQEKDIKLMMLTVPMHYKAFSNYDLLKKILYEEFNKYPNVKWLDFQQPYDTNLYTVEAFNNEYSSALHTTTYGAIVTAYKIADFLLQNYSDILPDRSKDEKWINDFKTTTHFAFNQDIASGMENYSSIIKNKQVGDFYIKELALQTNPEDKLLILKINNPGNLPDRITARYDITVQGKKFIVPIPMSIAKDVFPPKHKVFLANIKKEVIVNEILSVETK
ncbi:MAG: hypothetical protein LBU83_09035 [Bacteroidales bacterium]|jgi:hypothetical protein|nr:hypothetical protein [Bacteroidales bacterium]